LFYILQAAQTRSDIWVLPMTGNPSAPLPSASLGTGGAGRKPFAFLQTQATETNAQISPDGKWVAYESDESGRNEVYVTPFPGPGSKWQVSVSGGSRPRWRRDAKEIFYLAQDAKLMAAEIRPLGTSLEIGTVRPLFQVRPSFPGNVYDVTGDGKRFLVNSTTMDEIVTPINLVVNWPAALKK
jgi:dipeptidyl aminopeptidase/acylaminoacyl peptidase